MSANHDRSYLQYADGINVPDHVRADDLAARMAASTHVFSSAEHAQLVPYLAALHASCITHDRMVGTFLPPLHHEKLLAWWKERIAEVNAGRRVIVLLLDDGQPGGTTRAKGTDLMGVAMLGMPDAETATFRGYVEKVLVSSKFRGRGGAKALMGAVEAEAFARGKRLLVSPAIPHFTLLYPSSDHGKKTLDVESETAAEGVFRKLGYVEVGRIPKYSLSPSGQLRPQTFFYKELAF